LRLAAGIAALFLAGCDSAPQAWSRDEIADIAADQSADTSDLEARVAALEAEVERLRTEQAEDFEHFADLSASFVESGGAWDKSFESLEHNQSLLFEHVNYLRALEGLPPIPKEPQR
jgi:outer membrane murein-binding lipoprotein Lpp